MPALPPPRVPPDLYDHSYYRETSAGSHVWSATGGAAIDGLYYGFLARAQLRPGETVVDMGTGRGELLAAALEQGAVRAYGIEYSPAAVELARLTIEAHRIAKQADVLLADLRSVPLPDGTADLVCFVEVVEHLTPTELHAALCEARRLLKPHGRIVVYTMPNRLIYSITYRVLRLLVGLGRWPRDPRNQFEHLMHVNELSPGKLRRALRLAGLRARVSLGSWVYTEFVPNRSARGIYRGLARLGPLAPLAVADLWAVAYR